YCHRDTEPQRWRDREKERGRDGETERRFFSLSPYHSRSLSVSVSLWQIILSRSRLVRFDLKFFYRGLAVEAPANFFGQHEPFDLHRRRAREIGVPERITADAFEIEKSVVAPRQVSDQLFSQLLTIIEAQDDDQLFAEHGSLRPDVVGRENAELFHLQVVERPLDVFGIDVLALLGDDHIFDPAEELQMALSVKSAQVASHQPPVDDRLHRQFGVVQVM